jgi:hypothetical protein
MSLASDLDADLAWLACLLQRRLDTYFAATPSQPPLPDAQAPPDLTASDSSYAAFVARHGLEPRERAVMLLALAPLVRPQLLEVLWERNPATQRGYSEFGGVVGPADGHFIPTAETAVFLLAGDALAERLAAIRLLTGHTPLFASEILRALQVPSGELPLVARLQPGLPLLALLGLDGLTSQGESLPAQRIETGLAWTDLVLPADILAQLEEIRDWLDHSHTLLHEFGLAARLRPGYTCLFHGPSGTGKTLSATLLGKLCGREVHRVDLSIVVSKYIGETEKNLSRVFDLAEQRGWILFFDEADALFGQRTRVDSSHDRYANQEVSYLLQRIEDFPGVVILSSNLRTNIDEAFIRRFQSVIAFPLPGGAERLRLWAEGLPTALAHDPELRLEVLADKYEIAGGTIVNVIRYAVLKSLVRGDGQLLAEDVHAGLRRELIKEGRGF